MSIPVSMPEPSKDFKQLEPGTYAAVCDMVVNIGVQQFEFQDEVKNIEQLYLRFEIPSERLEYTDKEGHEQNKPMVIGTILTNSLHEKAKLRHFLDSWRGKAFTESELQQFDLSTILGKSCILTVVKRTGNNGKTYANIAGIGRLMKGVAEPKAENTLIGYHPEFQREQESLLPQWIKEKIAARIQPHAEGGNPAHESEFIG